MRDAPNPELPRLNDPVAVASRPRHWLRWSVIVLVVIALAAGVWYWRRPAAPDPSTTTEAAPAKKGGRLDPTKMVVPVAPAVARAVEMPVRINALGTVTARNIVTVRARVDGQLMRVAFQAKARRSAPGDLLAEIDPRPFQVQLAQAQGQMAKDQALLQNAQIDLERYRDAARAGLDREAAGRHAGVAGAPVRRRRCKPTRARSTARSCSSPTRASPRRSAAASACARSIPATSCARRDANGIVVITQLQPISVVFPIPEDNVPRVMQAPAATASRPSVEAWDREQKTKLATGKLVTVDNQIDTTTGTVKLKAEFANEDLGAVPEPVRQRAHAGRDAERRDAGADRGDPARRAGHVRLRRQGRPDGHGAPVKLGPSQGEVTVDRERRAPGELVVVDGADKLREGAQGRSSITREAHSAAAPPRGRRRAARRRADGAAGRRTRRAGAGGRRQRRAAQRRGRRRSDASAACARSRRPIADERCAMNPSRLFILRPVATTLLMVAILLAGHRRVSRAAAVGAAARSTTRRSRSSRSIPARAPT